MTMCLTGCRATRTLQLLSRSRLDVTPLTYPRSGRISLSSSSRKTQPGAGGMCIILSAYRWNLLTILKSVIRIYCETTSLGSCLLLSIRPRRERSRMEMIVNKVHNAIGSEPLSLTANSHFFSFGPDSNNERMKILKTIVIVRIY